MATKKRDPVLAVLQYFQTADVALAQQALSLAQAIVKTRSGSASPARPSTKPRPMTAKPPGPQAAVGE
jgi:hypothetical protein